MDGLGRTLSPLEELACRYVLAGRVGAETAQSPDVSLLLSRIAELRELQKTLDRDRLAGAA